MSIFRKKSCSTKMGHAVMSKGPDLLVSLGFTVVSAAISGYIHEKVAEGVRARPTKTPETGGAQATGQQSSGDQSQ